MVLTFYLGEAAAAFKQYAVYVQRRTATHLAQFDAAGSNRAPIAVIRRAGFSQDGSALRDMRE